MQTTEYLSAGSQIIDKGRRDLDKMLNNLRSAIKTQVCRYTIGSAVAVLEEYAEVQFCEEERRMKHFGYPDYSSHKEKHGQFTTELDFLREELRNIKTLGLKGSYELSVETIHVVTDWISGHVMKDDRKLCEFLREYPEVNDHFMSSGCSHEERVDEVTVTICSICKKIRSRKGLWKHKEHYREIPAGILYSHGLCPECLQEYYADLFQEKR